MENVLNDKDNLVDMLSNTKFAASSYNMYAGESSCDNVRNALLQILEDEHDIQNDIFIKMNSMGLYPTTPADRQKIEQAKSKFPAAV